MTGLLMSLSRLLYFAPVRTPDGFSIHAYVVLLSYRLAWTESAGSSAPEVFEAAFLSRFSFSGRLTGRYGMACSGNRYLLRATTFSLSCPYRLLVWILAKHWP